MTPGFSVIVPTIGRLRYLALALSDLAGQDFPSDAFEVVVVDDDPGGASEEKVREAAARLPLTLRYVRREGTPGLNGARNTGIEATAAPVVAFIDDDCRPDPGWLAALATGIAAAPRADCFGGPIRPGLPPGHPRWCGREPFPLGMFDRGPVDRYVDVVYGGNLAIRRSAFERFGRFAEDVVLYGDELEWILRLRRGGGLVRYVAGARLRHVRLPGDGSMRSLVRWARLHGDSMAKLDRAQGLEPWRRNALGTAARMTAHAVRRRCWSSLAHATESFAYLASSARASWSGR